MWVTSSWFHSFPNASLREPWKEQNGTFKHGKSVLYFLKKVNSTYTTVWPWTVTPSVASPFSYEVAVELDVMVEASPGFAALRLQPFPLSSHFVETSVNNVHTCTCSTKNGNHQGSGGQGGGPPQRGKGSPMHVALTTCLGSILKGKTPCQEEIIHNYTLISFFKTWKRLL